MNFFFSPWNGNSTIIKEMIKMYANNTYMPKKPTHGSKTSMNKSAAEFLIEVSTLYLILNLRKENPNSQR